jgi:hypothetical protein
MTIATSLLPRHCAREVKDVLRTLPPAGDWRIVKTKDHYFLYDGPTRVACVNNNSSKPVEFIARQIARTVKKYADTHYA